VFLNSDVATLTVPASITKIDWGGFDDIDGLNTLIFKDGTERISGFKNCNALAKVVIPASVTTIDYDAFNNAGGINVTVFYCEAQSRPSGWSNSNLWNSRYCIVWDYKNNDLTKDGGLYVVENGVKYQLKNGEATVIGQPIGIKKAEIIDKIIHNEVEYPVTKIDAGFGNSDKLEQVKIADSVKTIEWGFVNCSPQIIWGENPTVTTFGNYAFSEYKGEKLCVFHFDMYRIEDEDDLYSIGFYDYADRNGICMIEWSENIEYALPDRYIRVKIEKDLSQGEDERIIFVEEINKTKK
jgi:hypothetical protein